MDGIHVAAVITAPDGGEDARIEWQGGPERTPYLPVRLNQFQLKAGPITPGKAGADVLGTDGRVKPMIKAALDAGGNRTYMLMRGDILHAPGNRPAARSNPAPRSREAGASASPGSRFNFATPTRSPTGSTPTNRPPPGSSNKPSRAMMGPFHDLDPLGLAGRTRQIAFGRRSAPPGLHAQTARICRQSARCRPRGGSVGRRQITPDAGSARPDGGRGNIAAEAVRSSSSTRSSRKRAPPARSKPLSGILRTRRCRL